MNIINEIQLTKNKMNQQSNMKYHPTSPKQGVTSCDLSLGNDSIINRR